MVAHSPYDGSMLRLTNTINFGVTGIKGKIPVQFQQDHQGGFSLVRPTDTQPQGWEGTESKPHKGGTPKQSRKWGIHL